MKTARGKWGLTGILGFATFGYAVFVGIQRFAPLEYADWAARSEMHIHHADSRMIGGLHFWTADRCGGRKDCGCVLLIHGLGDTALTWKKFFITKDAFFDSRIFAVDLPGSGASPAPSSPADYRVRTQAKTVLNAIGSTCAKYEVIGNSLGGWIAAWMALDQPEKVSRLVLMDSAGLGQFQNPRNAGFARGGSEEEIESALKDFQQRAYYKPRPLPEFVWKKAVERMKNGNSAQVAAAQVPDDDLTSHLSQIPVRTLVLWGTNDQIIPKEAGEEFARKISVAQLVEAPFCGHLPQKECPEIMLDALKN